MGWWGYDLLSGDPPMDTLGELGDFIGIKDLYPLSFTDAEAASVRAQLESYSDALLTHPYLGGFESLPVVAAAFLATGATMSDRFKAAAINAANNDAFDGWSDGGVGRAATLADLVQKIEAHQSGERIAIVNKGLFETLSGG